MKSTIDRAGRLVIPKDIRRAACLTPGTPVEIRWRNDHIEIEPSPIPVRLQRQGNLLVAIPQTEAAELTAEVVEKTRSALIDDRSNSQ